MSGVVRTDDPETGAAVFEVRLDAAEMVRMDRGVFSRLELALREVFEAATGEADKELPAVRRRAAVLTFLKGIRNFVGLLFSLAVLVVAIRIIVYVVLACWSIL